ncbi:MAG: 50S ribosomal protein L9 [Parcubacteria group bacterium]|nr:50S ribosomal protein L9 [Parcubacteria group bacterium]
MKIILLQDVPKVGRKYEVKDMADGFARNLLIPQGKAEVATEAALLRIKKLRDERQQRTKEGRAILTKALQKISGETITLTVKANAKGSLFEGVDGEKIRSVLQEKTGTEVPVESLLFDAPLKKVGEYAIAIRWEGEEVSFTLKIEADK